MEKSSSIPYHAVPLDTRQWELLLSDALHSIRSLLSTATNQTPHERLFNYQQKSSFGTCVST